MKIPENFTPEFLLPHRPPMIVPCGIRDFSLEEKTLTSWTEFDESSIFYNAGTKSIPAHLGIEMMAQTIGLLSGIYAREILHEAPKLGFLLGARHYENFAKYLKPRERYFTFVRRIFLEDPLVSFECKIFDVRENPIAQAELNVFRAQNDGVPPEFSALAQNRISISSRENL